MQPSLSVVVPYSKETARSALALARDGAELKGVQVVLSGDVPPSELPTGVEWVRSTGGKGNAMRAALGSVTADVVLLQDADAAYNVEAWQDLALPVIKGEADAVWGRRTGIPLPEVALGRFANWVTSTGLEDPLTGQKAVRTQLVHEAQLSSDGDDVDAELLVKLAAQLYRFREVPVHLRALPRPRALSLAARASAFLRYATTHNDSDNAHEGYNTLSRMEAGAPNYNTWLGERFRQYCGARVLEVGAGIGTITALLAEGREKVTALEVDPFYVKRLHNRFRDLPQVEPYLSDVALADWEKLRAEKFDTIVLSNVLEHIADDADAVRRFGRILPKGGKLIIFVPALMQLMGSMDEAVGHHRRYVPETLRAVLTQNGFSIDRLEWMNLVGIPGWYVNSKLLKRRAMPPLQLRLYDAIAPLLAKAESHVKLPIGLSLFCVATNEG
jgi:SAM-dependent methyltransferase